LNTTSAAAPDVVFNALHGEWGEDGCVQGVLETLGLPYTHCGVLASALAMDKAKAKAVLAAAGVVVPGGGLFNRFEAARDHVMAPPYVVKPNAEGSTIGLSIVRHPSELQPAIGKAVEHDPQVLVDQDLIRREMIRAAQLSGATIVGDVADAERFAKECDLPVEVLTKTAP